MKTTTNTASATPRAPIIVNYGVGVDSTAMLVGFQKRGITPDLIIFADTGDEKPETYAYLAVVNEWLDRVGFPQVTVFKYQPTVAKYTTLSGLCIINQTLPSLAFGKHSCSLRFKAEVIDRYLNGVSRGKNKCEGWGLHLDAKAAGVKSIKHIGYDNGKADTRRSARAMTDDGTFEYRFPLQDWGWDREECIRQIAEAGLLVPIKSACFQCPASKKWEVMWLAAKHTELFLRAVEIERNARDGKHGLGSVKGLGRNWSWEAWATEVGFFDGERITITYPLMRRYTIYMATVQVANAATTAEE